jgi:hypothetical protein
MVPSVAPEKNPQWHHWGSNPRPSDKQRSALTTTLPQDTEIKDSDRLTKSSPVQSIRVEKVSPHASVDLSLCSGKSDACLFYGAVYASAQTHTAVVCNTHGSGCTARCWVTLFLAVFITCMYYYYSPLCVLHVPPISSLILILDLHRGMNNDFWF